MTKRSVGQEGGGGQVLVRVERESNGTAPKTKYVIRVCPNSTELSGAGDIKEQQYNIGTRHTADLADLTRQVAPNEPVAKSSLPKSNLKNNNNNLNRIDKCKNAVKKVTIAVSDKLKNAHGYNRNSPGQSFGQNKKEARPSTASKICEKVNRNLANKREESIVKINKNESGEIYRMRSNESVQQKQNFSFNNIQFIKDTKRVGENKKTVPYRHAAYDSIVDTVKKMKRTHWTMIDKMYKQLINEKYVMYKSLSEMVNTIIDEVHGKEIGKNFLQVIDDNKRNAITKVAKILLNLYQEAYEEYIHEKSMAPKRYYHTKFEFKAEPYKKEFESSNRKLDPANLYYRESRKPSRCEACHTVDKSNSYINKISPNKCKTQKPEIITNKIVPKNVEKAGKPLESSKLGNNEKVVQDLKPESKSPQPVNALKRSESRKTVNEKVVGSNEAEVENLCVARVENGPTVDCSTKQQEVLDMLESSLLRLFQAPDEVGLDEAIRSAVTGKEEVRETFQTTLDLLWLNDRVEKGRLENELKPGPAAVPHCQAAHVTEEISKEELAMPAKSWLPEDCLLNMGYVNVGLSVMFGIAAAYFTREEVISSKKLSMKATLKKYLKQFLLGALRLVDGS